VHVCTDPLPRESPRNLTLGRIAIDHQLAAEEPEGCQVLAVMDEHRQVSVEVADLSLSPLESDFRSDVRNPVGENGH